MSFWMSGAAVWGIWLWAGRQLERWINRIDRSRPLPVVDLEAAELHYSTPVVDLHNDSLLFERNILKPTTTGHIDLTRAEEGGIALLGFAVATRIPLGFDKEFTDDRYPDALKFIYALRRSPLWKMTPFDRAVQQALNLQKLCERSAGRLRLVLNRSDVAWVENREAVGALLGFEGSQAVGPHPDNIDLLFRLGYRVAGLAHFIDTPYAFSAHGRCRKGLTPAGKQLVTRCVELGMIVDVSHLSEAGIDDVLTLVDGPVIASHTGLRGHVDNNRNLRDDHALEIGRRGGLLGIGFWDETCGSNRPEDIVDTIEYAVDLLGPEAVGFGSDFDGSITPTFDISQLPVLTQLMMARGWPKATIKKVLGDNVIRLLRQALPD